ncbi:MAG: SurA N-terminal domain-containing protein, partial [Caldilineaceae bacterium]|nr:SurA N-terminal domain-containing protein [Caldilineaceae bacterium]
MAKKQTEIPEVAGRQTRKEELRARKQQQQLRQVKIAVGIVLGLLVLVVLVGVITEFFIVPNRAVATVDGEPIALRDWQERVVFERAQRIIFLENQYEAFAGDVGIIQQFAGQTIVDLQSPEVLAQDVLDSMVDETVIRQEAEARGITVTDADVDARIAEQFNFFGGESPTPVPTGTATAVPTPSLTPIPTPVITDVVPTSTPFPTP